MKQRLKQVWQTLMIQRKIMVFTSAVFVTCLLSVIFNVWIVKFSMLDFSRILEENSKSVNLVQAIEQESDYFQNYVQRQEITEEALSEILVKTRECVYALPFDYNELGEARYAQTWSIRNSYEVYVQKRDLFLSSGKTNPNYITDLYELYDMQKFLDIYAKRLMSDTMEIGSEKYQEKIPNILMVPWLIILIGAVMMIANVKLAQLMNSSIIGPVMKLVNASKRIADNDFFIEDIQVESQDELGELVHAFNKMKYATGEYIMALEEKRKTLDLLHEEELEKLAVENQLEAIKLDLLKSQVNPHFLFNTLNVIGGMASLEDAETTEKMIKALSSLFRYNLKTDDIMVPLARELKVVEDYMYLQQMRFGDRISCDMSCEVDKDRVLVPAFTFQPLAENAIIHGLSHKEEGGSLTIRVRMKRGRLYLYFADTGVGMSAEKLSLLKANLKTQNSQKEHAGIGLGNIYRRVHSMYPDGKVKIYSKENRGTVIIIVIPQENEANYVSSNNS